LLKAGRTSFRVILPLLCSRKLCVQRHDLCFKIPLLLLELCLQGRDIFTPLRHADKATPRVTTGTPAVVA